MLTDKQCGIISALCFGDMNLEEAARIVGCHRNNIAYHIATIKEKTGLDARSFFDLHELYKMAGGEGND